MSNPNRPAPERVVDTFPSKSSKSHESTKPAAGPAAQANRSESSPSHAPSKKYNNKRSDKTSRPVVEQKPEKKETRVGGARNNYGTRISRHIECSRCGADDHVPFVPKDMKRALCRPCAVEVLKTYEVGVRVRVELKKIDCNLCGKPFEIPASVEDDGDLLCRDCLQGFTSWSGSVDTPYQERNQVAYVPQSNGTLLRKRLS